MKHNILYKFILLLIFSMGTIIAQDEALSVLNLQGVIRDDKGGAVDDGNYPFTFSIYNVLTGGTALWSENLDLDVVSGVYSANLGEDPDGLGNTFAAGNLGFDEPYYIGVSFNNKNEISPRVRLTAAPYALALQGADNVFPSSGTVGVGTNTTDDAYNFQVLGDSYLDGNAQITGSLNTGNNLVLNRTDMTHSNNLDFNSGGTRQFRLGQATSENLYLWYETSIIMKWDHTGEVTVPSDLTTSGALTANSIATSGTVEANNLTIDGSAPFVIRRYDMGTKSSSDSDGYWTTTKATGVSSSAYYASVIGVNGGIGGIDATNQYLFGAFMYDTGSTWTVYSRFPGNTAGSSTIIWVLFIQKELVDGPTTWN